MGEFKFHNTNKYFQENKTKIWNYRKIEKKQKGGMNPKRKKHHKRVYRNRTKFQRILTI